MQFLAGYDDIILDDEFQKLLPPLAEKVLSDLEASLLQYGVRDPLVTWNGILIDGYNRFSIIGKHGLSFNIVKMDFASRDEVIIWMIKNQLERRNLSPMQVRHYRGIHYNTEKRLRGNSTGKNQFSEEMSQNGLFPQNDEQQGATAKILAKQYNVSRNTIMRDAQIANAIEAIGEISPDIKSDILSGKTHITNKQLQELSSASAEDIKEVISQIEEGTFESRKPAAPQLRIDDSYDPENAKNILQWELKFKILTEEFQHIIRTRPNPSDTTPIKSALRQYIQHLETLYEGM